MSDSASAHLTSLQRVRASRTGAQGESGEARERWGRVRAYWRDDGRLVDRFERTSERCRQDAEAADEIAEQLGALMDAIGDRVELGRECGSGFHRRFAANLVILETVARRDNYFASELARVEAEDAERAREALTAHTPTRAREQ